MYGIVYLVIAGLMYIAFWLSCFESNLRNNYGRPSKNRVWRWVHENKDKDSIAVNMFLIFSIFGWTAMCWPITLGIIVWGPQIYRLWRWVVFSKEERTRIALGTLAKEK